MIPQGDETGRVTAIDEISQRQSQLTADLANARQANINKNMVSSSHMCRLYIRVNSPLL